MTGYAPNIGEYVRARDGSIVPWKNFTLVDYVIHDGWRIGLDGEYLAIGSTSEPLDLVGSNTDDNCAYWQRVPTDTEYVDPEAIETYFPQDITDRDCVIVWSTALYGVRYGYQPSNKNSTFNNTGKVIHLPTPTLNISMFYLPSAYPRSLVTYPTGESSGYHDDAQATFSFHGYNDTSEARWAYNNETYDMAYLKKNGTCPQQDTYKWGFSFLLLFIFCIIQAVWFIGMYILWMEAYLSSRHHRAGRDMGIHRAALDFATAIRKDMSDEATEDLGNTEIRRRLRRNLDSGVLRMNVLDPSALPPNRAENLKIQWRAGGGFEGRIEAVQRWSLRKKICVGLAVFGVLVGIVVPSIW